MTEFLGSVPGPWLVLAGVALTAIGGLIGAKISARSKDRETAATVSDRIIDQLQEELDRAKADREDHDRRTDAFWADKAAGREYIARLKDHIYQRKAPPPPEPPAGYIP